MTARRGWLLTRLRGFVPRSRLLRVALVVVPLLLVLAVVEPVLGLIGMVFGALAAMLRPLLEDPYGRLALVCVGIGVTLWSGAHLFRDKIHGFRASLLLRRHLDGIAALLGADPARSRRLLEAVARARGPLPPEFPLLREDACLKLARLALHADQPARAQAWLLRVHDTELPQSMARSWVQLRAQVEIATPGALPASVERVVRESLARFPDDVVLLRLLRDLAAAQGQYTVAASTQERVARVGVEPEERTRLATLWLAAADQAWAKGDAVSTESNLAAAFVAERARAEHSLLPGEVSLVSGDLRGALRQWARVPGSRGLCRCTEVLDTHPRALSPREILEVCPTQGGLLLAARSYVERGEHKRALRTALLAAGLLPDSPTAALAIADILRRAGAPDAEAWARGARARLIAV